MQNVISYLVSLDFLSKESAFGGLLHYSICAFLFLLFDA